MHILRLDHDWKREAAQIRGQFADPSHAIRTIDSDTTAVAPDGRITAVLVTQRIKPELYNHAYADWSSVDELPDNRATAAGSPSLPRLKNDGTLGKRWGVPKHVLRALAGQGVAHGSIGYLDATRDQPCHKTPLSKNRPEMLDGNERLVKLVDELYKQYLPKFYAKQRAEVEKVPRWRLWNTVFSTIYLAKNFRTAYHRDSGNLKGVMTALLAMGNFTGGELVLPRWRIGFAFKPGDLLLFDPQQLHGNLPFQGERLSAAFYCEKRIADCRE